MKARSWPFVRISIAVLVLELSVIVNMEPGVLAESGLGSFQLGVEYMVPGLGEVYRKMGVNLAKSPPLGFGWDDIEPHPPKGGVHSYDWDLPDAYILEYQRAGFTSFHIYVEVRNKWATSKKPIFGKVVGHIPKEEHLKDYADFIRNYVERYDGDGIGDVPGLLYPIRYWEIEAEWSTYWKGTVDEYLKLLRIARTAVKEADPEGKIIMQGFLMMMFFDQNPDRKELERRISDQPKFRHGKQLFRDIQELLKHPDLFDAVEFHSLSDWTEIIGATRFLRDEMKKNGYEKPIWVGDVNLNINPMIWWGEPVYPYVKGQKGDIRKFLQQIKKERDPLHARSLTWLRAEQARFTAKKILCAMGEGLAGMNMGIMEDLTWGGMMTGFTGTSAFCGLIDVKGLKSSDRGPAWQWADRIPGEPRPAYWTIELLVEKLDPYTEVRRIELGKGIYAYRFSDPRPASGNPRAINALWYEDGKGELPGDPEPKIHVSVPVSVPKVTLIPIITEVGQKHPIQKDIVVHGGYANFELTETPVLILE